MKSRLPHSIQSWRRTALLAPRRDDTTQCHSRPGAPVRRAAGRHRHRHGQNRPPRAMRADSERYQIIIIISLDEQPAGPVRALLLLVVAVVGWLAARPAGWRRSSTAKRNKTNSPAVANESFSRERLLFAKGRLLSWLSGETWASKHPNKSGHLSTCELFQLPFCGPRPCVSAGRLCSSAGTR
jgi:hypothetical protein